MTLVNRSIKCKHLLRYSAVFLSILLFLPTSLRAQSAPLADCSRGYILGFFNGVWNLPDDAFEGLEELQTLYGDTYEDEPLVGEVFLNVTGSTVGATALQDLAETFVQRAREIDSSGELENRFEFLWEILADGGERSLWDRVVAVVPAVINAFAALYDDLVSKVVGGYSLLLSNPPTESDYTRHNARLNELARQGQKLLLVAHSQGNLFVNHAYDHIAPLASPRSVGVVHIAPASPTLRGGYELANIDLVINGLRLIGSVPDINLNLSPSVSDLSGHTLIKTYLDGSRPGRARTKSLLDNVLEALETPEDTSGNLVGIGYFTVTLTWNGSGDVDLHTFEPNGVHVYYASPNGTSGSLDFDNTVANGPEHYSATCDASRLQEGVYQIGINNYARATGRIATIQAATIDGGELITRQVGVGPVRGSAGDGSPIPVFTVNVSRNPNSQNATDRFIITAH